MFTAVHSPFHLSLPFSFSVTQQPVLSVVYKIDSSYNPRTVFVFRNLRNGTILGLHPGQSTRLGSPPFLSPDQVTAIEKTRSNHRPGTRPTSLLHGLRPPHGQTRKHLPERPPLIHVLHLRPQPRRLRRRHRFRQRKHQPCLRKRQDHHHVLFFRQEPKDPEVLLYGKGRRVGRSEVRGTVATDGEGEDRGR